MEGKCAHRLRLCQSSVYVYMYILLDVKCLQKHISNIICPSTFLHITHIIANFIIITVRARGLSPLK